MVSYFKKSNWSLCSQYCGYERTQEPKESDHEKVTDSMLISTHPVSGMANRTGLVWLFKGLAEFGFLTKQTQ